METTVDKSGNACKRITIEEANTSEQDGLLTIKKHTQVDNPASFAASALTRTLTYNYVYALHALLLVMPHWLCFDWSMGCVPLVTGWSDARNAASLLLWLFLAASAYQALASPSVRQRRSVPTSVFFRFGTRLIVAIRSVLAGT